MSASLDKVCRRYRHCWFHFQSQSEHLANRSCEGLQGRETPHAMGRFFFQVRPLAFFFFVPVFPSTRPSRGLSASFPSSAPLVKSQWPPFGTVAINIYESRAPRRGLRVTNTVTFQRATVYCVCQEAGEDKGRDYPPPPTATSLAFEPNESRPVFGSRSASWYDTINFSLKSQTSSVPGSCVEAYRMKSFICASSRRDISIP